jgi:hypothetical protein
MGERHMMQSVAEKVEKLVTLDARSFQAVCTYIHHFTM